MPSGPPELHEYWCEKDTSTDLDGNRIYAGDLAAIKHLKSRGYKMTKHWSWIKPPNLSEPSKEDNKAINYLVWEWDFGGLE